MNEASGKDTFSINENIKCAITAIENGIEHKGMKRYKNKNNIGYIFLTNNDNPLKVPVGDRRFCGIECNNSICNNKEYFDALRNEMNTGDYNRAFYDYWMSLDVNNYDFTNNRPETSFYNDMKELNTPVMVKFLEHIIDINSSDNIKSYTATELYNYFNSYLSSNKFKVEYTSTKFGLEIKKFDGIDKKRLSNGYQVNISIQILKSFLITKYKLEFNNDDFIDLNTDDNHDDI